MNSTPMGVARAIVTYVGRRKTIESISEIKGGFGEAAFFLHDMDGGILKVTVSQFKEPQS